MAESFADVFYTIPDGLTLYARDYAGPGADSPVVLCLHGLSRNSRDFADLAPLLQRTHRVIVPDQRGRGRSEWDPQPERYTPTTYIGDMLTLLDQLSVSRCALVGTSMGGLMSFGIHALSPSLLTHVVINDIGPVLAQEGLDRIKQYVGSTMSFPSWELAAAYISQANAAVFPHYTREDWAIFTRRMCTEKEGGVWLDYDPLISAPMREPEGEAELANLWPLYDGLENLPVMLIRGGASDLLDPACAAEMRARHPNMTYLEVPGVGHAPMLDEPGVADAICEFINR